MERADVAIVGAGIVGLMAARSLLAEGRRVLLLDRGEPGRGASFGNAGILAFPEVLPLASPDMIRQAPRWLLDPLGPLAVPPRYAAAIAPWLFRFWRASRPAAYRRTLEAQIAMMRLARAEMAQAIEASGLGNHVSTPGTLDLYEGAAAFEAARGDWAAKEKAGIGFEIVSGSRIEALQPGLAAPFRERAVWTHDGMQVADPFAFAQGLADHVEGGGASLLRAEVTALVPRDGEVEVRLADGRPFLADAVVLTAGAWSKRFAASLGDKVPLETERGYNTTLPPGSFDLRRQLYFNGHGFVVTPIGGGVRVGGAVELGGLRLPPNFRRSEALLAKAARFLPDLKIDGGTQWMGFRPSLPDSLPVIGRARATPHVVYAFGHGHLGLTQSAATGRLVADLVTGRMPAIDVSPFSPMRFN